MENRNNGGAGDVADPNMVGVTHANNRLLKWKSHLKSIGLFIYNPETRECIGRDGLSWVKISLFYCLFYIGLASFYVGLVAVFVSTLSWERPTYYAATSTMSNGIKINPGLGFRPQLDPEDALIIYRQKAGDDRLAKLNRSLTNFLVNSYDKFPENGIEHCYELDLNELREQKFTSGLFCPFNYRDVLDATPCDPMAGFGYADIGPCVALKLNKIYSWLVIN